MIKKIMRALAMVVVMAASVSMVMSTVAYADACDSIEDHDSASYKALCGDKKTEDDATGVVKSVLNTVFIWIGIVSTVVVIVGGVFYMLSQGDPGKVARAKNTILYALIGLIVSLLSFAIVNFVLEKVAGK